MRNTKARALKVVFVAASETDAREMKERVAEFVEQTGYAVGQMQIRSLTPAEFVEFEANGNPEVARFVCRSCGHDVIEERYSAYAGVAIEGRDPDGALSWDTSYSDPAAGITDTFVCAGCFEESRDLDYLVIEADKFQGGSNP